MREKLILTRTEQTSGSMGYIYAVLLGLPCCLGIKLIQSYQQQEIDGSLRVFSFFSSVKNLQ